MSHTQGKNHHNHHDDDNDDYEDSNLINLVRRFEWDKAIQRIETHPQEILQQQTDASNKVPSVSNASHDINTAATETSINILVIICQSIQFHKPPPFQLIQKIVQIHPHLVTSPFSSCTGTHTQTISTPDTIARTSTRYRTGRNYNVVHNNNDATATMITTMTPLHALFYFYSNRQASYGIYNNRDIKHLVQQTAILFIDTNPNVVLLSQIKSNGFLPLHILLGRQVDRYQYGNYNHRELLLHGYCKNNHGTHHRHNENQDDNNKHDPFSSPSQHGNNNDDNDDKLIFFKKMILTKPQSLIICNKGGISCLEMFWSKYCIKNDGNENIFDGDTDTDSDGNGDNNDGQQRQTMRRRWRRKERQFLLCPQSAAEYLSSCSHSYQSSSERECYSYSDYASQKTKYTRKIYPYLLIVVKAALQATRMMASETIVDCGSSSCCCCCCCGGGGCGETRTNTCTRKSDTTDNITCENEDEVNLGVFLPLHSFIGIPCAPVDMVQFALMAHGTHELRTQDSSGNTPLHIAVQTNAGMGGGKPNDIKRRRSTDDTLSIILQILEMDSSLASIPNNHGYYPLFLAIRNGIIGWDDGLSDVFDAYSDIIGCVDPKYQFYPFIYAAMCRDDHYRIDILNGCSTSKDKSTHNRNFDAIDNESEEVGMNRSTKQLNTTFQLLRRCPALVHGTEGKF